MAEKPMSGEVGPTEMEMRVAGAMYDANPARTERHLPWDQMVFGYKLAWIVVARAAIRAMREPTDAMLWAAHEIQAEGISYGNGYRREFWPAMIDAATPPIQENATAAVPLK